MMNAAKRELPCFFNATSGQFTASYNCDRTIEPGEMQFVESAPDLATLADLVAHHFARGRYGEQALNNVERLTVELVGDDLPGTEAGRTREVRLARFQPDDPTLDLYLGY